MTQIRNQRICFESIECFTKNKLPYGQTGSHQHPILLDFLWHVTVINYSWIQTHMHLRKLALMLWPTLTHKAIWCHTTCGHGYMRNQWSTAYNHHPDFSRQSKSNSSELCYLLENQFVDNWLFAILIIRIFSLVSPQVYLTAVVENVEWAQKLEIPLYSNTLPNHPVALL